MNYLSLLVYALPLALIYAYYLLNRLRKERANRDALAQAEAAGLLEPVSLHPLIDNAACIACAACITACPETPTHQVIGIIDGKAQLVSPTDCIGHGACRDACPTRAITLVFGTERRGVEIPMLNERFETTVPGLFIAGELGGMGLIRNALMQGMQATQAIGALNRRRPGQLDLLIVGAGPAGLAAALTAKSLGLTYQVLEQDSLGGSVFQYPRRKLVMTRPVDLPLLGRVHFKTVSKEELLAYWERAAATQQLAIEYGRHIDRIERTEGGFHLHAGTQTYTASSVLLAIGRRGTPRKLGVTGEELPKVVYRLIAAEQYRGSKVVVVGGGDSALEAAASIAEQPDTQVVLSYRGEAFMRAKPKNRERVARAQQAGNLQILLKSSLRAIAPDGVLIDHEGRAQRLPNDFVIVNAGGTLPNDMLKAAGIDVTTKYGTA